VLDRLHQAAIEVERAKAAKDMELAAEMRALEGENVVSPERPARDGQRQSPERETRAVAGQLEDRRTENDPHPSGVGQVTGGGPAIEAADRSAGTGESAAFRGE
jgi:hypothetical protein